MGVVVFVLITGYFSFSSKFKFKSLLKTCFQVSFYSIGCYVTLRLIGVDGDFEYFTLTPVLSGAYWFVTVWVGLYLAMPFLNCVIRSFSRDGMRNALMLMAAVLCVVPIVFEAPFIYSNFLYFVFLYFLGAFFGKWGNPLSHFSFAKRLLFAGLAWVALFLLIALATLCPSLGEFGITPSYAWSLNSFVILPAGVMLFLLVEPIDLGSVAPINIAASGAFGVYLLSDNYLVRPLLWSNVGMSEYAGSEVSMLAFILRLILAVLVVYASCAAFDLLRLNLLEKPLFSVCRRPIAWIDARVNAFFDFEKQSESTASALPIGR